MGESTISMVIFNQRGYSGLYTHHFLGCHIHHGEWETHIFVIPGEKPIFDNFMWKKWLSYQGYSHTLMAY